MDRKPAPPPPPRPPANEGIQLNLGPASAHRFKRKKKSFWASSLLLLLAVMGLGVAGGVAWILISLNRGSVSILPIPEIEVSQGDEIRIPIPVEMVGYERGQLTFSLSGAPTGAKIDEKKGEIFWCPPASLEARTYKMTVAVVGPGTPQASDRRTFSIRLRERPMAPRVAPEDTVSMPLPEAPKTDLNPFEIAGEVKPAGRVDELVFAKLKELKIEPANLCSDGVFVRRAYLDLIGTLPTPKEAKEFLQDKSPEKRRVLIDRLLDRPEYADYWAMKWSDLLRIKAEFPINLWPNAAQAYHRFLRASLRANMPYDQFVRQLLTSSGSNFRVGQVNFYRAVQSKDPVSLAKAAALAFMGVRAEKWPKERLEGMAAFFAQVGYKPTGEWKEEIVMWDPRKKSKPPAPAATPAAGGKKPAAAAKKTGPAPAPAGPKFPDDTAATIPPGKDPREVFTDWLIRKDNPWFARHIVNRMWYWMLGRGVVHEPDDIRPDNPAQNPELLTYLAEELVKANYDLKHIYRLILNSTTYQLSSIPKSKDPNAAANFACYSVRRLDAEVLIDAICQVTGTTESYMSIIPEPYSFIPEYRRTIQLPDGSITSSFLETFGRPPRDTGLESERNNRITAGQRLHLLNSSHIRNKLRDGPGLKAVMNQGGNSTENVYLAILSRLPTSEETGAGGGDDTLAWALINSNEFLFRH